MPGSPEISRRISNRYCPGEGHLELASSRSILFNFDLKYIRSKVAGAAFSPEDGVEFMNDQEPINILQKEQLFRCLSAIATGDCKSYPIINN